MYEMSEVHLSYEINKEEIISAEKTEFKYNSFLLQKQFVRHHIHLPCFYWTNYICLLCC